MATRRPGKSQLAALRRRLDRVRSNVFDELAAELEDQAGLTLAKSNDNAPQLTGQMQATAGVQVDSRKSAGVVRAVVYYTERYALYQHEGVYNPGPVTTIKLGPTRGIGRKFLQRALDERREQITVQCGRAVERALRLSLR